MDKNQAGIILVNGTSKARGNGVRRLKGKKYARPVITSWRWLLSDALGREKRWMDLSALKLGEFAHRKAKTRLRVGKAAPTTKRKKGSIQSIKKKKKKTHTNQKQTTKKKNSRKIGTAI